MSTDDKAARKSRAEQLRAQISKYKDRDEAGEDEKSSESEEPQSESSAGKSPRDFINDRMHELDDETQ